MAKRIKLLVLMTFDVGLKTWSEQGILDRELATYRELVKKGIDVTFLTFGGVEDKSLSRRIPEIKFVPVYANLRRPESLSLRFLQSLIFPWIFRAEFRAASILKTNQLYGGWVLVIARLLFRKPLVVRCGYDFVSAARDTGASAYRLLLMKLLSKFILYSATYTILSSARLTNHVRSEYRLGKKGNSVIGNSVNLNLFSPSREIKNGRVLFVGRLEKIKRLELLIDAVDSAQVGCDLVGDGRERTTLERYARGKGVDCRFFGYVKNEDLPSLFNRCAVFVLISKSEWLPKSLIEAMACGCIVIGSKTSGIEDLIIDRKTGLLVESDATELSKLIKRVTSNPDRYAELGENARLYVEQEFDLELLAGREFKVHQNLGASNEYKDYS